MPRLGFDYDSSYTDTDPYEPQPGGCCTLPAVLQREHGGAAHHAAAGPHPVRHPPARRTATLARKAAHIRDRGRHGARAHPPRLRVRPARARRGGRGRRSARTRPCGNPCPTWREWWRARAYSASSGRAGLAHRGPGSVGAGAGRGFRRSGAGSSRRGASRECRRPIGAPVAASVRTSTRAAPEAPAPRRPRRRERRTGRGRTAGCASRWTTCSPRVRGHRRDQGQEENAPYAGSRRGDAPGVPVAVRPPPPSDTREYGLSLRLRRTARGVRPVRPDRRAPAVPAPGHLLPDRPGAANPGARGGRGPAGLSCRRCSPRSEASARTPGSR